MFLEVLGLSLDNSLVRITKTLLNGNKYKTVDFHNHDEMEILYLTDGVLIVYTPDGGRITMKKGDGVVFNGRIFHKTIYSANTEYYNLQFSLNHFMELLNSYLKAYVHYSVNDYTILRANGEGTEYIGNIISSIYEIHSKNLKGSVEMIIGKICELIGVMINCEIVSVIDKYGSRFEEAVAVAVEYINENFSERIYPEDIARKVNLNVDYLGRIFKKRIGKTLMEHLTFVRLREAKKLLVCSDKSITEIAMETGFSSVSYFARVFKAENKVSPGVFRKAKSENDYYYKHIELKNDINNKE